MRFILIILRGYLKDRDIGDFIIILCLLGMRLGYLKGLCLLFCGIWEGFNRFLLFIVLRVLITSLIVGVFCSFPGLGIAFEICIYIF